MIFKLYDCDFGITLNGVNYDFEHVDGLTLEDPERTRLVRGGNAGNKLGLAYREGTKEAKTVTVTIIGMPFALYPLMKKAYEDKTRVDCYCISRVDGSSKIAKNAILSQEPQQLTVDESAESMNTALVFESYDVSETHKS
jgi:hypothetical protein